MFRVFALLSVSLHTVEIVHGGVREVIRSIYWNVVGNYDYPTLISDSISNCTSYESYIRNTDAGAKARVLGFRLCTEVEK